MYLEYLDYLKKCISAPENPKYVHILQPGLYQSSLWCERNRLGFNETMTNNLPAVTHLCELSCCRVLGWISGNTICRNGEQTELNERMLDQGKGYPFRSG